jgi:hypothetical protein
MAPRIAAIPLGLLLSVVALAAGGFYVVATGWSCHGSDASQPPPPGSVGDFLCTSPLLEIALVGLCALAVLAPLLGGIRSAAVRRWRPLLLGVAAGAGGFALMGVLVYYTADGGVDTGLVIGLPLVVFAWAAIAARG